MQEENTHPCFPCPCCGFLVFDEEPGSYNLCPVCDWEDDAVQLRHPSLAGGANHYSLREGQQRILARLPLSVSREKGYLRDPQWRPLTPEESTSDFPPQTGQEYFETATEETPVGYYWRRSESQGAG